MSDSDRHPFDMTVDPEKFNQLADEVEEDFKEAFDKIKAQGWCLPTEEDTGGVGA